MEGLVTISSCREQNPVIIDEVVCTSVWSVSPPTHSVWTGHWSKPISRLAYTVFTDDLPNVKGRVMPCSERPLSNSLTVKSISDFCAWYVRGNQA